MTHSLSMPAIQLLAPSQLYAPTVLGFSSIPKAPGVYGWYFAVTPPGVPLEGTHEWKGFRLLYVGIAPRAPMQLGGTSGQTLAHRLRTHAKGPIGSSTLRRTLACLLSAELQ